MTLRSKAWRRHLMWRLLQVGPLPRRVPTAFRLSPSNLSLRGALCATSNFVGELPSKCHSNAVLAGVSSSDTAFGRAGPFCPSNRSLHRQGPRKRQLLLLNPIEQLSAVLKRRVGAQPAPSPVEQLWERVEREWWSTDPAPYRRVVESMPRRIEAVIKARGCSIRS